MKPEKYIYLENEDNMILDYGKSYMAEEYYIQYLHYEKDFEYEERMTFRTESEMMEYLKENGKKLPEKEGSWIKDDNKGWER